MSEYKQHFKSRSKEVRHPAQVHEHLDAHPLEHVQQAGHRGEHGDALVVVYSTFAAVDYFRPHVSTAIVFITNQLIK